MICSRCQRENTADARFCAECGVPLGMACSHPNAPDSRFCNQCGQPLLSRAAAASDAQGHDGETAAQTAPRHQGLSTRFEAHLARRGLTQFVGRDAELRQLVILWQEARQGSGRIVSVVGEAGLGKSRLLHEFKHTIAQAEGICLEGSCFAYGNSISYLPFIRIVKDFFALDNAASEDEAKRQIVQRVAGYDLDAAIVVPYLHNLLTFAVDDELFAALHPHLVRERTVQALKAMIVAAAKMQPFVLIIEDAHWIDKATEEVVSALVEGLASVPLLLVLVYRPEYLDAWTTSAHHSQIVLDRLPGASSADMVRAILDKPHVSQFLARHRSPEPSVTMNQNHIEANSNAPELERLVANRTDGNPFFVEELTLSLLESGDLVRAQNRYVLRPTTQTQQLPTTLQAVLLGRIDRLSDSLKHVLQGAAVIGRVFSYPVLARVGEQAVDLDAALIQLEDLEFIYPMSLAPYREYSFKHVLTQQAIYGSLSHSKLHQLHERIGAATEALYAHRLEEYYELLAYHYSRSGDADKAIEYLDRASQKAGKVNALAEAKMYFYQAMMLLDSMPDTAVNQHRRVSLIVNAWVVFWLLLEFSEYYDISMRHEATAVELGDTRLLGTFYARVGWCEFGFGRFDQSIQTLAKATQLCEASGNAEDAGQAEMMQQWSYLYKGDYDQVFVRRERVRLALGQRFNLRWFMLSLTASSLAYSLVGQWDNAVKEAQEALHRGEEFSDSSVVSFAAWVISLAHTLEGDLVRAIQYAEMGVQKAQTPANRAWAQGALGFAWCRAGEPHRGVELLAEVVSLGRVTGWRGNDLFTPFLGEGYWLTGDFEKARQTLEELLGIAESGGMRFHTAAAHRLLAEIALSDSTPGADLASAAPRFETSIAILRDINAQNELAHAYAGYGRLHQQQGNIAQARDYLTRALEGFERMGHLLEPEKLRRVLAELPER